MEAAGGVKGFQQNGNDINDFTADNAFMEMRTRVNLPKEMNLKGNVQLGSRMEMKGESRNLQTSALLIKFAEHQKGESVVPEHAETLARGTLEWTDPAMQNTGTAAATQSALGRTKLAADKLELNFDADGKANQLIASGSVVTERTLPGKPQQTATAQNGSAQLQTSGWSQIELAGNVKLKEGDRSGQADRALFVRSAQTATLAGDAGARDAPTETRSRRIRLAVRGREIRGYGSV